MKKVMTGISNKHVKWIKENKDGPWHIVARFNDFQKHEAIHKKAKMLKALSSQESKNVESLIIL